MKRFAIALLVALAAFTGFGVAWAEPDGNSTRTIQAP